MSPKSFAEKLLIKPNTTVWASDTQRLDLIQPLPGGVLPAETPEGAGAALVFADGSRSLRDLLAGHATALSRSSLVWVMYPKANRADINRDTLWPILAEYGMRPITQVAIDDVWSALRFRPLREGEEPFRGGR
jgi:hypothetical protein